MNKTESIKENRTFRRLYSKGKRIVSPLFILYVMPNRSEKQRLGITVSKKIGKAVERNRAKRIIREAFRLTKSELKPGFDIIFVARASTVSSTSTQIKKEMNRCFTAVGLFRI